MHHEEEKREQEKEEGHCDAFSAEKVFGVATLGAVGTLGLYFLYNSLSDEARKKVKERFAAGFKAAIRQD